MQIKLIVSAAAIALVAGIGSASAVDQMVTMEGIAAEPMAAAELAQIQGKDHVKAIVQGAGSGHAQRDSHWGSAAQAALLAAGQRQH